MSNLSSLAAAAVFALVALTACNKDNPNFCEGTVEECMGTDAPPDSPPMTCTNNGPDPSCEATNPVCVGGQCTGQCDEDTDCTGRPATEAVCLVGSGDCVQCDENGRQADPNGGDDECPAPQLAVCDGTSHTCRECRANDECFTGICDAGRCAAENEIIFLAVSGADNADCTRAAPCRTLNEGVSRVTTTLKYIFMAPNAVAYDARNNTDRVDINGRNVFILGTGASVQRNGDGEVLDIHGSSIVTIDGLTIKSGRTVAGHAIKCQTATVNLRDATLTMNAGAGVDGSSCTLTMVGSTVSMNAQAGINLSSSDIKISRSDITSNPGGGIQLASGSFEIVNNFVTGNGHLTNSTFAGLKLSGNATSKLEFNTIALNIAPTPLVDGVECIAQNVTARNNIIIGSTLRIHTGGTCAHAYTLFTPDGLPAGTMNRVVDSIALYNFASGTDYHIGAGSTAAGGAQTTDPALAGESLFDIDGEARVPGGTVDIGADEI